MTKGSLKKSWTKFKNIWRQMRTKHNVLKFVGHGKSSPKGKFTEIQFTAGNKENLKQSNFYTQKNLKNNKQNQLLVEEKKS